MANAVIAGAVSIAYHTLYRPQSLRGEIDFDIGSPEPPPPEGISNYDCDLAEVRVKGALISKGDGLIPARTIRESQIGLFWAYDGARLIGTPPRLYNQILRKIAIDDDMNLVGMARLFALCNIAKAVYERAYGYVGRG